jgi:hypothetical protein
MSRPSIGLLVRPGVPTPVVTLLTRLQRWADVRAASTEGPAPSAYVATSPHAHGIDRAGSRPLAVWVDGPDETEAALASSGPARLLLTSDPAVADALGPDTVVVPPEDTGGDLVARTPFVRRRWRRRVGFPDDWTVTVGAEPTDGLDADDPLVPTALSLAAAAVVTDPAAARRGLATGCPMVVDPGSAAALGIEDGVHALVQEPGAPGDLLRLLVDDDGLAAALSRSGRVLYEQRHDAAGAVLRVAGHLGVLPDDADRPVARLDAVLDALHTPEHARARHRAHELLAGLPTEATCPA